MEQIEPWHTFNGFDLDAPNLEPFEIDGVTLVQICQACPEAYDARLPDGTQLGYLRLRGGRFTAVYPDVSGELVYEYQFSDSWQGCFSPEERKEHLPAAVKVLVRKHSEQLDTMPKKS